MSFNNCKDPDGKLVYGVQGIGEKAAKKRFEELMVFMKGFMGHIPFESETYDVDAGTEPVAGLEDMFEIVSGLENEKCVTSSQMAARKNEDRERAKSLRNASLGNLSTAEELIKSYKVVDLKSSSAKKRPANNSPDEIYRISGSSAERLQQSMCMKVQKEFYKENRKNRQLELKAEHDKQQQVIELQMLEHAKQQEAIELQKLGLQTRASEALFVIIQDRQNLGDHYIVYISFISIINYSITGNTTTIVIKQLLVNYLSSIDQLYHNSSSEVTNLLMINNHQVTLHHS